VLQQRSPVGLEVLDQPSLVVPEVFLLQSFKEVLVL
jgi:hypothetical protein